MVVEIEMGGSVMIGCCRIDLTKQERERKPNHLERGQDGNIVVEM